MLGIINTSLRKKENEEMKKRRTRKKKRTQKKKRTKKKKKGQQRKKIITKEVPEFKILSLPLF